MKCTAASFASRTKSCRLPVDSPFAPHIIMLNVRLVVPSEEGGAPWTHTVSLAALPREDEYIVLDSARMEVFRLTSAPFFIPLAGAVVKTSAVHAILVGTKGELPEDYRILFS